MDTTQMDSWYGAVGAIGCGMGIRYGPAVLEGGPPVIAVVVGCCLLMMLDALSDRYAADRDATRGRGRAAERTAAARRGPSKPRASPPAPGGNPHMIVPPELVVRVGIALAVWYVTHFCL